MPKPTSAEMKERAAKAAPATPLASLKKSIAAQLDSMCRDYRATLEELASLELVKKAQMEGISEFAKRHGLAKVDGGDWMLIPSKGGRTDISATKLLAAGVDMDVIEEAKVKSSWTYWQVTAKGGNSNDDAE